VDGLITHDTDLRDSSTRLREAGFELELLGIEDATRKVRDFKTRYLA